jgi:hypothetical protein
MQMKRPGLASVLVGMLALLVVGGIALSLSSAPPVAVQQLSSAAKATMATSGFALTDTNAVTAAGATAGAGVGGQNSRTVVIRVLYQAPDRVQETEATNGQSVSVIAIGSKVFRNNGSKWTELPSPDPGVGAKAAKTITSPLQVAANATTVTRHGNLYQFVPARLDEFLSGILGVRPSEVSAPRLTAEVRGDFLVDENITALVGQQRLEVDLAFSAIGSAPPVHAPPATPQGP